MPLAARKLGGLNGRFLHFGRTVHALAAAVAG
jgi:hypothetical protein